MRVRLDVTSDALESECGLSRDRPPQTRVSSVVVGKEGKEEKVLRKPRRSAGGANEDGNGGCLRGGEIVRVVG